MTLLVLWLHLLAVVVWVGGLAYQAHVLLLVLVALAAQRDFAHVPRLRRAVAAGEDAGPALRAIGWLDRVVLALALVIIYLGLAISRA